MPREKPRRKGPEAAADPVPLPPPAPFRRRTSRPRSCQDSRIANGDRSGQLTNRETANVDRRENNTQNFKALGQAGHNGHLTKREQRRLNRRQNRLSRTIHRDKHNRRVRA